MDYEARVEGQRASPSDPYDSWGRSVVVSAESFGDAVEQIKKQMTEGEVIYSVKAINA